MAEYLEIRTADLDDLHTIGYLAYQIWPVAYKEILTFEQLHYMLQFFYSPEALRQQMTQDHHIFLLAEAENEEPVGFASYSKVKNGIFKLHKLYVLFASQGKSIGRFLLDMVEEECREAGGKTLLLNVNRNNKAKNFYEKLGYKVIKEENVDIGNGFFQDDYVMEKKLNG